MNQMKYSNQTDDVYGIKAAGSKKKTFVLWREVVMAYAAPAIMAGIGDWLLQIGASNSGIDHNWRCIGLDGLDDWAFVAQPSGPFAMGHRCTSLGCGRGIRNDRVLIWTIRCMGDICCSRNYDSE